MSGAEKNIPRRVDHDRLLDRLSVLRETKAITPAAEESSPTRWLPNAFRIHRELDHQIRPSSCNGLRTTFATAIRTGLRTPRQIPSAIRFVPASEAQHQTARYDNVMDRRAWRGNRKAASAGVDVADLAAETEPRPRHHINATAELRRS